MQITGNLNSLFIIIVLSTLNHLELQSAVSTWFNRNLKALRFACTCITAG